MEKRQSSINQTSFTYKNNVLDICKSYPYLGTVIPIMDNLNLTLMNFAKKSAGQCTLC